MKNYLRTRLSIIPHFGFACRSDRCVLPRGLWEKYIQTAR
jgi:hypothetical protein